MMCTQYETQLLQRRLSGSQFGSKHCRKLDNTLYTKPNSALARFGILQSMSQNAAWDTPLWDSSAQSISKKW